MHHLTQLGLAAAALTLSTLAPPAMALAATTDVATDVATGGTTAATAALPAGKASGSHQYGLIGSDRAPLLSLYGVTVAQDGTIWYANPGVGSVGAGLYEYRPLEFDPLAGDYRGSGEFSEGGGYLATAWEAPVHYTHRDSTRDDPAGGSQPWAEPRGVEALAGGRLAVNDTNGVVNDPIGTIVFYDAQHRMRHTAGFASDQGCTQLAAGELMWGPYFTVLDGMLYAPYQGCNVVSAFSDDSGKPRFRLTGERQQAGLSPNDPQSHLPGDLAGVYGTATDGQSLYTTDLGIGRAGTGAVQRWSVDPANHSWQLDTSFGDGGAVFLPGTALYSTSIDPAQGLYIVPGSGMISKYDLDGTFIEYVQVPGIDYSTARDLSFTPEGWLVMTARTETPLMILAKSPSPLTGLTVATDGNGVDLAWDISPVAYGQAPIIDYLVETSADDGRSWTTVERQISSEAGMRLAGLTAGEHTFRVTAVSEAGYGDPAEVTVTVTGGEEGENGGTGGGNGGNGGGTGGGNGGGNGGVDTGDGLSTDPAETGQTAKVDEPLRETGLGSGPVAILSLAGLLIAAGAVSMLLRRRRQTLS